MEERLEDAGALWIVATPIGTIDDLGVRARRVLASVDYILAEDTRVARALLSRVEVAAGRRLRSLHDHNERDRVPWAIGELRAGRSIAIISDAGTPAISDPGFVLVRAAREARIRICSVPGPSAFTAALAAAGQPPLPALLAGFLPPRRAARRRRIEQLASWPDTLVVLLSPHRLADELADLAAGLGEDREGTLLAEISKRHERGQTATLVELTRSPEALRPRGEYVLVVGPAVAPPSDEPTLAAVRRIYDQAVASGLERREALRCTAARLGVGRREVYSKLLEAERKEHDQ